MIPAHAQRTLDDIRGIRQRLDDAEAAILAVYQAGPPADETPAERDPDADQPADADAPDEGPMEAPPPAPPAIRRVGVPPAGGKYDAEILRALRSEHGQFGLPLSDVTRAIVGPGKPAEVKRLVGTIHGAMQSLQKRGEVRKDGRMWHVVRRHQREAVSA
jgi:hypothetical protein